MFLTNPQWIVCQSVLFILVHLLHHGMNPRHGMITHQLFHTTRDYVKLCSTLIVLECPPLTEISLLAVYNVVNHNPPPNEIHKINSNAVSQFILVQTQTFTHHGYKSTIIVLIPINGLVTPIPNSLMPHQSPICPFHLQPQLQLIVPPKVVKPFYICTTLCTIMLRHYVI